MPSTAEDIPVWAYRALALAALAGLLFLVRENYAEMRRDIKELQEQVSEMKGEIRYLSGTGRVGP